MRNLPVVATGLDLGGDGSRVVVTLVEDGYVRLLGAAETNSEGWVKGRIADQNAVAESVRRLVSEVEHQAQISVDSVVAGVGGPTVRGATNRAALPIGNREVNQRDVNRLVKDAIRVLLAEDRLLLHACVQDFVLDGHPGHPDPRRMSASQLEVNVYLITASKQEHNRLVTAIHQANLAVDETVFEPLAACYAAVLPEERRQGLALIDIGAQSTELVIYFGETLLLASGLAVSGDHFTRDVARSCCASFEDAELIKREYGCAVLGLTADNSWVEVPPLAGREPREASRRSLNEALEARAEELFLFVKREVIRSGMDGALMDGVVLTGGGSRLSGMCDLAERILNCQARIGLAVGIERWPDGLDDPAWTTAAGLAMYAARLKHREDLERRSMGLIECIFR